MGTLWRTTVPVVILWAVRGGDKALPKLLWDFLLLEAYAVVDYVFEPYTAVTAAGRRQIFSKSGNFCGISEMSDII